MDARRVQIALRSSRLLWRYPLRSALIILSAAVGVVGVVCPVNYGAGGTGQLLDQIRRMGSNVLIITPVQDKAVAGRARTGGLVTTLVERDHLAVQREIRSRTRSSALVTGSFWIKAGDLSKNLAVIGCEPDYFLIKDWPADSGELFTGVQERAMARVVMLGHTVGIDLFGNESPVGRQVMINRVPFTVIGVLAERGQGLDLSNEDNQVYVPLATAMHRLMNSDHYSAILMETNASRDLDSAAADIRSILRRLHHIRVDKADDFQIQNQKTLLEMQTTAASRLAYLLNWIAGSSLAVSGLGILGISWIVIKEQTRGLGICRALGATTNDISLQVWFESLTLTLMGNCLGLLIAWPLTRWINMSGGVPFVFDRMTAVLALIAAATLNLTFAILPSRKAARAHPIEALRHE